MNEEMLNQIYESAFEDEIQKIAKKIPDRYQAIADIAQMAADEERELKALRTDFPAAYNKRNISSLTGLALGAVGGLALAKKKNLPKLLIGSTGALLGAGLGSAGGHAVAKAQDPEFAKRFSNASSRNMDMISRYMS